MKRSQKILVDLLLGLGLGLSLASPVAYAHEGRMDCGGPGMRHERGAFHNPAAMAERHLAHLKGKLKITPDQEPAWQAFAAKVKAQAKAMGSFRRHAGQEGPKAWPDRMARQVEFMKQRLAAMQEIQGAAQQLYQALTPEQRTVADQQHWGHRGRRR